MNLLTVIIPSYNEAATIKETVDFVLNGLKGIPYEVIVVDDGSSDKTSELLKEYDISVIKNKVNRGYGAAIKMAMRKAKGDIIMTLDADGQHIGVDLASFYKTIVNGDFDMVIGERGKNSDSSFFRKAGKFFIRKVIRVLARMDIYDFNSGIRIFKRDVAVRYLHLFPNGFSLSTTMTVALIRDGYDVAFMPIEVKKRKGRSTVSVRDAFVSLVSVIRLVMLFSPLNIFLPVSIFFACSGGAILYFDILNGNIQDITILLLLFAALTFFFGLIVDQMSHIRREIGYFK